MWSHEDLDSSGIQETARALYIVAIDDSAVFEVHDDGRSPDAGKNDEDPTIGILHLWFLIVLK